MQKFRFGHISKTGLFAAVAVAAVLFGGCGKTSNNLGGAADWYNDSVYGSGVYDAGTYAGGGTAYWDGYGINNGRSMTGNTSNGFSGTANDTYGAGSLPGTTGGATASALD